MAFVAKPATEPGIPRTEAEVAAGVDVLEPAFPELDIRRYGATCDYDPRLETDGAPARHATDNLPAFKAAIAVAERRGGGTILVEASGDCYVSNSINAKGIDNLWFQVSAGTTVRATRYTNLGSLFLLGNTDAKPGVRNVGIRGGGTLRTHRPRHESVDRHRPGTAYAAGDYVLSMDANGEQRAYYAKRAGVSGAASPPEVINGAAEDGTVVWQDADNDNVVSISGIGISVIGMQIPEASGKAITTQKPEWRDVWIRGNVIGTTNDKAIEVKGQQGLPGQRVSFGDGVHIVDNVIGSAGREGIEVEQSMNSAAPNRNCQVIGNVIHAAGVVNRASGIRINRCDNVQVRENRVLRASANGYHLRICSNVSGSLYAENVGLAGVNLQRVSGFAFESIRVRNAGQSGVVESESADGGRIRELVVEDARDGYRAVRRAGRAPVIDGYRFSGLSGARFVGTRPLLPAPQNPGKD